MKLMCIILSFAVLLAGCSSNTLVTKDDVLDASSGPTFVLKDGSSIEANSWGYFSLENGYQIASSDGTPGAIILDEQIETDLFISHLSHQPLSSQLVKLHSCDPASAKGLLASIDAK